MKKLVFAVLIAWYSVFAASHVEAKEGSDYLYLIIITKATGEKEHIYTDAYVLWGSSTVTSVIIGSKRIVGSGDSHCNQHMKISLKGDFAVMVSGRVEEQKNVDSSREIGWNDTLTILSQSHKKIFDVAIRDCAYPLIRLMPRE